MVQLDATTFMTIANILILFYLLKRFLFKPLGDFMENRRSEIKQDLDHAKQERGQAEELRQQYEAKLRDVKGEAQEIIKQARTRQDEIIKEARAEAEEEAEEIKAKAKEEIEQEKKKAVDELKREVAGLSIQVTERVLREKVDREKQKELVEKFIQEAGRVS